MPYKHEFSNMDNSVHFQAEAIQKRLQDYDDDAKIRCLLRVQLGLLEKLKPLLEFGKEKAREAPDY